MAKKRRNCNEMKFLKQFWISENFNKPKNSEFLEMAQSAECMELK